MVAVAGQELVVGRFASLGASADLVAGEVELAGAEAGVLEVAPERAGGCAQDVPVVRVAVDRLERNVEPVDDVAGRIDPRRNASSSPPANGRSSTSGPDLVEPGEMSRRSGSAPASASWMRRSPRPASAGVERRVVVVLDVLPERDQEAVALVRPARKLAHRPGYRKPRVAEQRRELELLLHPVTPPGPRERDRHPGDDGSRREVDEDVRQIAQDDRPLHRQTEVERDSAGSFDCFSHSVGSTTCRG